MENAVKIRILGIEFAVTSPDGALHAKNVAAAVNAKTEEITADDPGLSTSKAAIIAAMDFCESEMKFHRIALKLKKRILKNEEELSRLYKNSDGEAYEKEISSLKSRLSEKEKELKKRAEELLILKEDVAKTEEYKRTISEKERETELLSRKNAELEKELEEAQNRLAEMKEAYGDPIIDDDFELDDDIDSFGFGKFQTIIENEEAEDKAEPDDEYTSVGKEIGSSYYDGNEPYDEDTSEQEDEDEDIIIPGYLDGGEEDYGEENTDEDRLENPFGLDFSDR